MSQHVLIGLCLPELAFTYTIGDYAHDADAALQWQQTMEYHLGFVAILIPLPADHAYPLATGARPMIRRSYRTIQGIWLNEDGTLGNRVPLDIEMYSNGTMCDPCVGSMLPVVCEQWGNDAPIMTNGIWEFLPDDSELSRLGIVPVQRKVQ